MKINKKISKNISNSEKDKNISSLTQDKARSLDSEKGQAKNSSRIGLTDTYDGKIMDKKEKPQNVAKIVSSSSKIHNKFKKKGYLNIIKKNKNGLMAIHKALTGISLISNNRYINFSIYSNMRNANAPVGLMVFQRSQKPYPHRYLDSIPSSSSDFLLNFNQRTKVKTFGWSAFLNHSSNNIKHNLINI